MYYPNDYISVGLLGYGTVYIVGKEVSSKWRLITQASIGTFSIEVDNPVDPSDWLPGKFFLFKFSFDSLNIN